MKVKEIARDLAVAAVVIAAIATPTHYWGTTADAVRAAVTGHTATSAAATDDNQYAFLRTTASGAPVSWDRCAPVHLVVNLAGAPAGALDDLRHAVATISTTSGLDLVIDGTTTAAPSATWGQKKDPATGAWPPVLVAWTNDRALIPQASYAGWTTTNAVQSSYVSGLVLFNAGIDATYATGSDKPHTHGALYSHELGHLVGLAHVSSEHEMMNPNAQFIAGMGPGDVKGLQILGSQPCVPAP